MYKVLVFVLLILLAFRFYLFYSRVPSYKEGQEISFTTTLLSEPKISGRYQMITANLDNGKKIFVTFLLEESLHYGQKVKITGKISSQKNGMTTMYLPKIKVEEEQKMLSALYSLRENINIFFENTLPPNASSLLLGIVFGIKSNMSKSFFDNLRTTGVLHVVAASGMNVMMVGSFLNSILIVFIRRKGALIISILGIVFYALLSGLEPSIIRASIMGIFVFCAQILGRQMLSKYLLFITFCVMLFISPFLIYDVGFQLSFLATLGLLYLKPIIDSHFSFSVILASPVIPASPVILASPVIPAKAGIYTDNSSGSRVKSFDPELRTEGHGMTKEEHGMTKEESGMTKEESGMTVFLKALVFKSEISTAISAQIATLPIIMVNFGNYSFISLLTNAFLLWTIPILMVLGGIGGVLGLFIPFFGKILLYLSLPFLFFFQDTVNFFGQFKGVEVKELPWELAVGYYLILGAAVLIKKDQISKIKNQSANWRTS